MKHNLLGQKFARLLVIAEAEPVGVRQRTAWLCQCDCGIQKIIKTEELKNGDTKSCGCLNDEKRKERAQKMYSVNIKYHPRETTARRVWRNRYYDGISFEDFFRLSQLNCYYCGTAPNNIQNSSASDLKASQFAKENGDFIYNGLDRLNSSLPHTIDNVVPSCKWCNLAKRERSLQDFEDWIKQVYQKLLEREKETHFKK
jgi:hypothetical protein